MGSTDDGLHGEEVVAPSHGRTCTSVCAFFALIAACIKQVSWTPMLAGVYVIQVFFYNSVHICDTIAAGCAHALVFAQFVHLRW